MNPTLDPDTTSTERLRHAVIGVGANVFAMHRPGLALPTTELVGVSDLSREQGEARAVELGCPFYQDYRRMLAETRPDVAVILTPHPFHAPIAIDCLGAGCHVLVEKPIAVQVAEADAMIEAAERAGRLLAVNFQGRFRPEVRAAYDLIRGGKLGRIQHLDMAVAWPRMASYFRAASWRGTWTGEGAGVLLNQAPHNLDLICHLLGQPERVVAWTRTTLHDIETEDTVQAMLEWPGGGLGSLHISTAEAGRPERLEIVGTRGYLHLMGSTLEVLAFDDLEATIAGHPHPFYSPTTEPVPVPLGPGTGDHAAVYKNLHAAALSAEPLMADGREGRMSLELANAMILSSFTRSEVTLPLHRARYAALLEDLKAGAGR